MAFGAENDGEGREADRADEDECIAKKMPAAEIVEHHHGNAHGARGHGGDGSEIDALAQEHPGE